PRASPLPPPPLPTLFPYTSLFRSTQPVDAVVLHAGAARVPARFRNCALSLDSVRAAAAAAILGSAMVIPAHYDGWTHFSEGRDRSEEHTSELQSQSNLVCRLLLEK